jgi:hypothetical protein
MLQKMYCLPLQGLLGILFILMMEAVCSYTRITEEYRLGGYRQNLTKNQSNKQSVRYEAVIAAIMRSTLWDVTTCNLIEATDISASAFWVRLAYSSTLIMKVVRSSEMAWCHTS